MGKLGTLRRGPDKSGIKSTFYENPIPRILRSSPRFSSFELLGMYKESTALDKRGYKRESLELLTKILAQKPHDERVICRVARTMRDLGDAQG
ncbi:hypothetical protein TrRE_jg4604, partial [Triparma retinervis]